MQARDKVGVLLLLHDILKLERKPKSGTLDGDYTLVA